MVFSEVSVKAEGGGIGRGSAVREYIAVGPICSTSASQIKSWLVGPMFKHFQFFLEGSHPCSVVLFRFYRCAGICKMTPFSGIFHRSIVGRGSLSPSGSSSGFLSRFLLGFNTAFTSAMPMEVTSLEVSEFAELVKGDVINGPNMFMDGFVELEYFPMSAGV